MRRKGQAVLDLSCRRSRELLCARNCRYRLYLVRYLRPNNVLGERRGGFWGLVTSQGFVLQPGRRYVQRLMFLPLACRLGGSNIPTFRYHG